MTEHTPGPWNCTADGWVVGPERPHKQDRTIGLDPGQHLAPVRDKIAYLQCPTYEQQDANARLIAAAPDLLKRLEVIAREIDRCSGSPTFTSGQYDIIKDLIAKAKGENQ